MVVKRTIRRDVPMAKNRNDFTAPNMSIEKPHKVVPIHTQLQETDCSLHLRNKKSKNGMLSEEDLETGRLEEDDLLSIPCLSPSLVSCPYPHPHGLEKC